MVLIVGVNFKRPKHALFWLHTYLSKKECTSILFLSDPVFTLWETAFQEGKRCSILDGSGEVSAQPLI
jgi:hypothetical protein